MPQNITDHPETLSQELLIVGIGASAGGLEALQELISHLPTDLENIAVVIAQHLSPTYKSMLVQLLGRQTQLQVMEAKNGMRIQANVIYITPPDSEITIARDTLVLAKPSVSTAPKPSVDIFFKSLAHEKRDKAVGIILSGTGGDGALGIREIKAMGGVTIAQEPQTAKYDGMPLASIETGHVDLVLSPDKIGEELKDISQHTHSVAATRVPASDEPSTSIDNILRLLSRRTGTDFTNYKPSTICRRLQKRMDVLKITDVDSYLRYIEAKPQELDILFDNILIGVTTFFRDREAFDTLERYISKVLTAKRQIRVWVPGCATGEEAYSIALMITILLNNRLQDYSIQIFATDIDEKAIAFARKGIYAKTALENLPEEILEAYFIKKSTNEYEVIKTVRQMILFSKHDVTSNPPFLKLDLISCRNLLIYFGLSLQKQVIPLFHYALNPEGLLFLGKSETVGQFTDLFLTLEGKSKIFQRKRGTNYQAIKFSAFRTGSQAAPMRMVSVGDSPAIRKSIPELVKETFYNSFEYPYVIINDSLDVLEISGDVRMFLNIQPGAMNTNILKLANKDIQVEMRAIISKAVKDNLTAKGDIRRLPFFGKEYFVRIVIRPVMYSIPENALFIVIFEMYDELSEQFRPYATEFSEQEPHPRIAELEQELAGTREHMQTFIEELETSNEELQSLNEELQSSNEELQSSNEELETSNEELQSTNEELQIAYTELKAAAEEIERQSQLLRISEANLRALLSNTLQAFILIDRDYRIISSNQVANDLTGIYFTHAIETGNSIVDKLPTSELELFRRDFQKALQGQSVTSERALERGNPKDRRWFKFSFTPVIMGDEKIQVVSCSLLDITEHKQAQAELIESERLISSIFNAADIGICVTNEEGQFVKVNQAYCDLYGYAMSELLYKPFTIVLPEAVRQAASDMHDAYLQGQPESAGIWQVRRKDGLLIHVYVTAARLVTEDNRRFKVTTVTQVGPDGIAGKPFVM